MAITNAQQFKQLVNPPTEGKKRPGYRGEAAAASDKAGGRDAGRSDTGSKSGRGDGRGSSGPTRDPSAQFGFSPEEKDIVQAIGEREMEKRNVPMGLGDKLGIPSFLPTLKMGLNLFNVPTGNQFAAGFNRSLRDLNRVDLGPDRDGRGGDTPLWAQLGFNSEAEYLAALSAQAPSITEPEPEEEDEGLRLAFRANGGRIGFRGGDAARSDAASGRNAGRADPGGGVERGGGDRDRRRVEQYTKPPTTSGGGGGETPDIPIQADPKFSFGKNIGKGLPPKELARFFNEFYGLPNPDDEENQTVTAGTGIDISDVRYPTGGSFLDPKLEEKTQADIFKSTQFKAEGGIMNPDIIGGEMDFESARQMYGLGKLVKKVTRTVKKIAKSPIGKAALLYAGTAGLGSLAAGGGMGSLFKLGTYAPSSFAANVPRIFSRAGLKNILVGRPESIISPLGKDIFRQAATKGIFGTGGALSPLKAIGITSALAGLMTPEQEEEAQELSRGEGIDIEAARRMILQAGTSADQRALAFKADGGRIEYQEGSKEPVAKKTMPLLDMGGKEMDLREDGGFVPIGRMEKADDVPARLSKNEFVFTADAVRNAGDGDVDKGAEVMYNMMKNLEAGGDVSEESQGLEGARRMFQTSQRLEEVL